MRFSIGLAASLLMIGGIASLGLAQQDAKKQAPTSSSARATRQAPPPPAMTTSTSPPPGIQDGAWKPNSAYNKLYNAKTSTTLTGRVISVGEIAPNLHQLLGIRWGKTRVPGVQLSVRTDTEIIPVHLGPDWYMRQLSVQIAPNDQITVLGSRIRYGGKPAIIAVQVKRGNDILKLRDGRGYPLWASEMAQTPSGGRKNGRLVTPRRP